MDSLRGTAVCLIVVLHVVGVPSNLGASPPEWMQEWQYALEPYRVPTLLFLSGSLLHRSLRKPPLQYAQGKAANIAWPYVLWTIITAVALLKTDMLLSPVTWMVGLNHMWFLTILLFCYFVGPSVKFVPSWAVVVLLLLLIPLIDLDAYVRLLRSAAFFFLGAALSENLSGWQSRGPVIPLLAGGVALAWALTQVFAEGIRRDESVLSFALSAVGIVFLIWVAGRHSGPGWLQFMGRHSIVVYLAHVPAIGATWLLLDAIGVSNWLILAPVLALVGAAVPLLLMPLRNTALFRGPTLGTASR